MGRLWSPYFFALKGDILNVKHILLTKITDGTFALGTAEEIARKLRLGRAGSLALKDMLYSLVRSGDLLSDCEGRFGTAEQFGAKRGRIVGNARGFGFFLPDDGSQKLFLPRRAMKDALHGDDVLCYCVGGRNGDEGEVLAIIEHGIREVVGSFRFERTGGFVSSDDTRYTEDVLIPRGKSMGCRGGEKVVAEIKSYSGRQPIGEIVEVLGKDGDFFTEEQAIIRAHSLFEAFPDDVLREGEKQAKSDPLLSLEGRSDFRKNLIITIDGEDTRDIDDAISVEKEGGLYHLGVHIADVSHYVKRNSLLDTEAFKRGTSVYFPDRVFPMLPPSLSNGICSLNEGVPRLTLSCLMTVNRKGEVIQKKIVPSVICSRHRMTYSTVTAIAEGQAAAVTEYPDLIQFVKTAVELTEILKAARKRRGGIEMDLREQKILYSDGKITIPEHNRTISHEMIEEFMILANESVATIMTEMQMPFVYRVHEKPSEDKAASLLAFLKGLGVAARFDPDNVSPQDYQTLLDNLGTSPLATVVNRVMLRSMMKAVYSPENIGHFGLASDCYCHFTSPIRRYPDLCIHRIIKVALKNASSARETFENSVGSVSIRSSACERNAMEAERDVDALYVTAYMQDKIGERYEATVSGVTSFGIFAELPNSIEGLIPIETLPDDSYEFIEERLLLRGTKNSFCLGKKLLVEVVGVDRGARRVLFSLSGIL